ncbi:MAG: hypothetical protein CMF62_02870 [Magnetococcales bacterium]|nr:hypothetical protein [Magnetococcales bacterium]|tara:strand:- start:14216 stop:14995 length:780 start_codon:yes stop_codon:yes gene_type:complete
MGNTFSQVPETELYKLYFTNLDIRNNDNKKINLKIPCDNNSNELTSITFYIQFIGNDQVKEEVSIQCKYFKNKNNILKFRKHIISNNENLYEIKEKYSFSRVGFPETEFIINSETEVCFDRINNNNFIISINNDEIEKTIGILNIKTSEYIYIEPVIKVIPKIKKNLHKSYFDNVKFLLHSPIINNTYKLLLNNQYNLFVSKNTEKNIINVFDLGIKNIHFNNQKTILSSLKSLPRSRIHVYKDLSSSFYTFFNHELAY